MEKVKIVVFSHYMFDEKMREWGLNNQNVSDIKDTAFISIIGTKECLEYYLEEGDTKHYFNDKQENVLNLDFDDIDNDIIYEGHLFKTMTMEQAEKSIDFIEDMINSGRTTFCIHCRAGMSRSRAFAEFIYQYCLEHNIDVEYEERNQYTTVLNHGVLSRLKHAYWKKHKMFNYENENEKYPTAFNKF